MHTKSPIWLVAGVLSFFLVPIDAFGQEAENETCPVDSFSPAYAISRAGAEKCSDTVMKIETATELFFECECKARTARTTRLATSSPGPGHYETINRLIKEAATDCKSASTKLADAAEFVTNASLPDEAVKTSGSAVLSALGLESPQTYQAAISLLSTETGVAAAQMAEIYVKPGGEEASAFYRLFKATNRAGTAFGAVESLLSDPLF